MTTHEINRSIGFLATVPQPDYGPAAEAYFAAMAVQPSGARKQLLSELIDGLIADGIWSKLDWLSLLASHDAQAARLNAVNPARSFSPVNSPAFVTDRYYQGDFTSARYLNSGWDAATDGLNFQQNGAHMAVWVPLDANSGNGPIGATNARMTPRNGSVIRLHANSATETTAANASALGLTAWDRSGATAGKLFKNGSQLSAFSTTSAALNAHDFYALAENNAGTPAPSGWRSCAVCWGAHLTEAQHTALYNRLYAYLHAIGAA